MPTDKRQRQREGRQYRRAQLEAARKRRTRMRQGGLAVAIVAVIVVLVVLTSLGGSKKTNVNASSTTSTTAATTTTAAAGIPPSAPPVTGGGTLKTWACPNPDGSSPHMAHFPSTPPPMCIDPAKTYTVNMTTNQGDITFTLDTKNTPKTANNFAVLSWYHYYDGTSIDRIDTSIDIEQTGSPNTQSISDPGPGYNIPDEPTMTTNSSGQLTGPYKYSPGDVVMARGSGANSGSAQYFFVYGSAASALDSQGTYVTFGHITDSASLAVLQKIAALYEPCPSSDQTCLGGAPKTVVLISKITVTAS
ncbi:MAG: peptidylprolyl isomerase [Acidimicrobiales bacterium]